MFKWLICVNTYTVCTLVQCVQSLPDSAVPVSVGPRTQLSPLPDLWCRFSPGKSDFHNSSSSSVTLHHNNQHPRKYSPITRLKNKHTRSSQRVCSKVEGPGRQGGEWLWWWGPNLEQPDIIIGHKSGVTSWQHLTRTTQAQKFAKSFEHKGENLSSQHCGCLVNTVIMI